MLVRGALLLLLLPAVALLPACGMDDAEAGDRDRPADLLNGLGSPDPDVRDATIKKVLGFGKGAASALQAELSKGTPASRATAALCLERIGERSAAGALESFLSRAKTLEEILYALKALGRLGNSASTDKIQGFLSYTAPKRLKSSIGWIADKSRETEQGLVRNQAAEALARLGTYDGVPTLIDNLASNGWVRRDAHIRLRKMTGCKVDFGYNLGTSREARSQAIDLWKKWWDRERFAFKPDWTRSHKVFDVNKRR